ncbi:MAG TPA: Rossmann-like and DUF2520 domain-containing protein [Acidisarcina sp.]|nr:Rossmann-like and DUF2520 domain-containing protein [Acidisarcina sp.]
MPRITVIGLGNWGTSLVSALLSAGFPIGEVVVRRLPERASRGLHLTTIDEATLDAPILWICVPDGAIAEVCEALVARRWELGQTLENQIVLHSSGVRTIEVLAAASEAGAQTAAVHPLMTFPTRKPVTLVGAPFAVESSSALRRRLFLLVRRLHGEPFRIDSSDKILYHAAATLASPLLLSSLVAAQSAAMLAGLSANQATRLLAPIAASTVQNFISSGARESFSGPIARGDIATIQLHLQALAAHPILADVYRSLAIHALESLPVRKREEMWRVLTVGADASTL